METIRQCWAYNLKGQRCDHPAGHPGKHVVMDEWDDDECFNPIQKAAPAPPPPPAPIGDPTVGKCVACQHMHKGGVCKCGCHEHIG